MVPGNIRRAHDPVQEDGFADQHVQKKYCGMHPIILVG